MSRPETAPAVVMRSAAGSRQARSHAQNEDVWAIHEYPGGALYVVCDGVSTAADGRYAAEVACARLGQFTEGEGRRDLAALAQLVSEIDWELRGSGRRAMCTLALVWGWDAGAHAELVYSLNKGGGWSAPARVATLQWGKPGLASLVAGPDGDFHVVWNQGLRGRNEVYYSRLEAE